MNERKLLIQKLKYLRQRNDDKQQEYQKKHDAPECGFLTKEACMMAYLVPKMKDLGVTFKDVEEFVDGKQE